MDLTGQTKIVTDWLVDPNTGNITLTFKDHTKVTTFGTLVLEGTKLRSFLDSLARVTIFYVPELLDATTRKFHETSFSSLTNESTTSFV